mmetsp:Transcript_147760/g.271695  ORF Transcript_147760/g.271695 Transcript_147760/m.271695 type:complete len:112 (-) Transcript_147760:3-338(-)
MMEGSRRKKAATAWMSQAVKAVVFGVALSCLFFLQGCQKKNCSDAKGVACKKILSPVNSTKECDVIKRFKDCLSEHNCCDFMSGPLSYTEYVDVIAADCNCGCTATCKNEK